MIWSELVAAVAEHSQLEHAQAKAALRALCAVIQGEVANCGGVTLPGVATIACKSLPARRVRNPITGGTVQRPAERKVVVRALRALKQAAKVDTP